MSELKPCPFCGGEAVIHTCCELENDNLAFVYKDKFVIHCFECHITTLPFETKEEAIEAWNRRADNG